MDTGTWHRTSFGIPRALPQSTLPGNQEQFFFLTLEALGPDSG